MEARILQHLKALNAFRCQEEHIGYLHLLGMENDSVGVFMHIKLNTNNASEVQGGQIGVYGQVIVEWSDGCGKSHAVPGEGLTIGGNREVFGLGLIW